MKKYLASEKIKQIDFKWNSPYFSENAKASGIYRGHTYPFCLPRQCAPENLYAEIRQPALDYFARTKINWHGGQDNNPGSHLCDSQVCCVNFLYPFAHRPDALAALLTPIFPTLEHMLPIEDGQFVAFEWIGAQNYLKERTPLHGERTRGANYTSADAAVYFQHRDGKKQMVLIEWKYTESYGATSLEIARSGTKRTEIYRHLFDRDDCIIDKSLLPDYTDLFYEPFYQLMRQQFLAHEMEKACELGADIVSLLHISPDHNEDFKFVTSPRLKALGSSPTDVWAKLIRIPNRFLAVHSENLFGRFDPQPFPALAGWFEYLTARYSWIKN